MTFLQMTLSYHQRGQHTYKLKIQRHIVDSSIIIIGKKDKTNL